MNEDERRRRAARWARTHAWARAALDWIRGAMRAGHGVDATAHITWR